MEGVNFHNINRMKNPIVENKTSIANIDTAPNNTHP